MTGQHPIFRPTRPLPTKLWACLGIADEVCSLHWTRKDAVVWRAITGHPWRQSYQIVRVEVRHVPKKERP